MTIRNVPFFASQREMNDSMAGNTHHRRESTVLETSFAPATNSFTVDGANADSPNAAATFPTVDDLCFGDRDIRRVSPRGWEFRPTKKVGRKLYPPNERAEASPNATRVLAVSATIRAAPKFHPCHYHRWREEIWFWKDVRYFTPDGALIAELALGIDGPPRTSMARFMKETRSKPDERTFQQLFVLLDSVFRKRSSDHAIYRSEAFNAFKKFPADDIRSSWVRFQKVMGDVRTHGLTISNQMEYVRAMQALSMHETHRLSVLASMNSALRPYCPIAIREVTVRLLPAISEPGEVHHNHMGERYAEWDGGDVFDPYMAGKGKTAIGPDTKIRDPKRSAIHEFPQYG